MLPTLKSWLVVAAGMCSASAHYPQNRSVAPAPGIVPSAGWASEAPIDGDAFTGIAQMARAMRSSASSTVYSATTSQWMWGSSGPYPWDPAA